MQFNQIKNLIHVMISTAFLSGCFNDQSASGIRGDVIETNGILMLAENQTKVEVTIDNNGIVQYKIVDMTNQISYAPEYGFSHYHRWSIVAGEANSIWVYSSDAGFSVWKTDANGKFYQSNILLKDVFKVKGIPEYIQRKYLSRYKRLKHHL